MKNKLVVKVQVSLFASAGEPQVLIYDKKRDIVIEKKLTPEIDFIMDGENKKFFYAKKIGKNVELIEEAPNQKW